MLFSSEADNFTAKSVAPKHFQTIKMNCKDDTAIRLLAELYYHQLVPGSDENMDVTEEEYCPSPGQYRQ